MESQAPDCLFCTGKIKATEDHIQVECGARVCTKCAVKRLKEVDKMAERNRKIERENWMLAEQKKPLKQIEQRLYDCMACKSSHRAEELFYLF